MTLAEKIEKLPFEYQTEVIHFVEFLEEKERRMAELERQDLDEAIRRDKEMDDGMIDPRSHEEIMAELRLC